MHKTRTRIGFILVAFILLNSASIALAHKAIIIAQVSNGQVEVTCTFQDGSPMKEANIRVYNTNGTLLLQGETDEAGNFSFPLPQNVKGIKIVVQDLLGHRAELDMNRNDLHPSEN